MPDIDLTKVGFVGIFNGVTCANDLIVIDCKDFKIQIKGSEREITHCVVSVPWLKTLSQTEFDQFYSIFSNLINAKNTAQSVETTPKPSTIGTGDGDIWFAINKDGTTPDPQILPLKVITYIKQKPFIYSKGFGLDQIRKQRPSKSDEEIAGNDEKLAKSQQQSAQDEKQKIELKEQGFNALNETQKSNVVNAIASEIANIKRIKNTDTSCKILQELKSKENGLTTWQEWVMQPANQTCIHTVLQNLNQDDKWSVFSYNMVQVLAGRTYSMRSGIFDHSSTIRDEFLKRMYNAFCASTTGESLGLPKSDAVFSAKKTVAVARDGKIVPKTKKVDTKGVHHTFRRWKNKNQTFQEYITDKLSIFKK